MRFLCRWTTLVVVEFISAVVMWYVSQVISVDFKLESSSRICRSITVYDCTIDAIRSFLNLFFSVKKSTFVLYVHVVDILYKNVTLCVWAEVTHSRRKSASRCQCSQLCQVEADLPAGFLVGRRWELLHGHWCKKWAPRWSPRKWYVQKWPRVFTQTKVTFVYSGTYL